MAHDPANLWTACAKLPDCRQQVPRQIEALRRFGVARAGRPGVGAPGRLCGGSGKHRAVAGQRCWNSGCVRGWQATPPAMGSAWYLTCRRNRLEPPCTDPYARWCGRGRRVTAAPMPVTGGVASGERFASWRLEIERCRRCRRWWLLRAPSSARSRRLEWSR
jgi:hypothetical protein